jgi:hypothetical protein
MTLKVNNMTLTSIYNKVKPGLVKGVKPTDLLNDLEATAWQYAYTVLKDKAISRRLKTNGSPESITPNFLKDKSNYNDLFMDHYTQALKTLKKTMVK